MSKPGFTVSFLVLLISTTVYIKGIISTHCGMSGDLSDEVLYFLSPLHWKVFIMNGVKNNLCLTRSALSIPFQKVYLMLKFGGSNHSWKRRYKTLSKSREASVTEANRGMKFYSLQRVTSEFCGKWILQPSNKRIRIQWVTRQFHNE